eukprot:SM000075S22005  [mRNA]  locus=s75:623287:623776:- [translate_table: standard]
MRSGSSNWSLPAIALPRALSKQVPPRRWSVPRCAASRVLHANHIVAAHDLGGTCDLPGARPAVTVHQRRQAVTGPATAAQFARRHWTKAGRTCVCRKPDGPTGDRPSGEIAPLCSCHRVWGAMGVNVQG